MPLSPAELQQREAEDAIADQQRTAERQAKQADREQKAAADAARKADLSRQELEFRAQGMIPVTTADGNLHADPLFEQKQADKAAKEQAKAAKEAAETAAKQQRAALTRQGVRHAINPVDGTPIPFETADDVQQRRTEAAQQRRNQKLDDEIRAADADHDFQLADYESKGFKPLSRGADGTRPLETKALPKLKQDALFALQTRLQEQAKAVSGDADWIPFNEAATPEAQTAKQRLEALSQPGAELSEDDLAELEANDATKPLVARIRGIQTQLAKDDEINTLTTSHKSRIASLKLKRANPEKWFETERQRRASLPPDQLEADLETSRADLDARRADLETRSATLNGQLQLWNQKLETLEAQAAERRQRGLMASEIVTYTREDGTTEDWPRDLAAQREQITAQAQNTHALQQDDWAELQLQDQDWQREAALLAEAAERLQTTRQEQAQTAKTQFSNRLRFTPGMENAANEIEALQSEAETRLADLNAVWEGNPPPEAIDALNADMQAKAQQSLAAGQQRQQAAAAAYQGLQSALLPDKNGNTKADMEVRPTVIANLAEALQVEPQEAERLLSDMETLNWDASNAQDVKEKTQEEFAAKTKALRDSSNLTGFVSAIAQTAHDIWTDKPSDPRQTRLLSNGAVIVNPQITAEKDYTAAVNASTASPEAKAEALSRFPEIRQNAGAQVRQSFQELEGVYGKEWVKDWLDYDAKRPQDVTPEEWAMRFTEDRKNDSALRRVAQEIGWSFYKGGNQLRQQVSGLVGGITGSETAMQDATWAGRKSQAMQTSKELYGSASDNFLRAGLLEMTPEVATSIIPAAGGAKLAQWGIRGLAATGAGARLFPALAAVLEGSSTAAQAVKATQTLTRAGLAGASIAGGAQTYGAQISDIYGNLRRQGIEHPDALRMAQTPAILSAGVTAALTALGGASGVERLLVNPSSAKALFAKQFETQMKRLGFVGQKFVEGGLREFALEELPDEIFSTWQSGVASHPDDPNAGRKALAEFLKTLPEFAIATMALGGAGEGISSYQESSVLPAMHLRPETTATAWSAIENHRALTDLQHRRAALALSLAQGGELFDVEAADLAAAGWTRDGDKFKPVKDYTGPQVLDIDAGGLPVIKDSYIATLRQTGLAPVADAIGMTETETRNFYAQRTQPQPAGQTQAGPQQPQPGAAQSAAPDPRGSTAQSPVQTPAGKGTQPPSSGQPPAQSGTPVVSPSPSLPVSESSTPSEAPTTPAEFLANHLTQRGLPADQALASAREITARPEFAGMSYEQIIAEGPKFRAALDDLGIDGSLNSKDVATNPLKVQPGSKLAKVKAEMEAKAAAVSQNTASQTPAKPASGPKKLTPILARGKPAFAEQEELGSGRPLIETYDATGKSTGLVNMADVTSPSGTNLDPRAKAKAAAVSQSPPLPVSPSGSLPPAVQTALDDAIPGTPSQAVFAAVKQAVQAKEMTEQQAAEIVAQQSGAQDHTELRQSLENKLGWNPTRANTAAALHFGDKSKSDIPLAAPKRGARQETTPGRAGPDQSWQDPASPLRKHRAWTTEKLRVLSSLRRPAAPTKGASASAQKKYQKALRAFESKQAWTREVFRLLENDIAKHHAFIEAIALGKTARQHLDGNSAAITVIGGKVTLAIDADALIANISDLESPQDRIEATFNEEYIHVAQKKLEALDPKNYGRDALIKKWDALPDALRKAVWTSYRNANQRAKSAKDARLPATLSDGQKYHLMQEFNRMLVQDQDFAGKITETVDPASGLLDWVKSMLQKLGDILREMITRLPKAQQSEIQEHVRRVSELYQQFASASQGTSAERLGSIPTVTDHQAVATQALTHFMSAKDGIFQPAALAKIWDLLDPSLQRLVFRSKDRDPVTGRFGQQIASRAPKHDLMRDLLAMTATDPAMARAVQEALLKPGTQATKSLNLLDRLFTAFADKTAQNPAPALASSSRTTASIADALVKNAAMDGWLDTYIGNGWADAEREFPGASTAIARLLEQLPSRQHDRNLHRAVNSRFGEVERPFYSFSFSPESARLHGDSLTTKQGPTKYLSFEDVAEARIRRDGKSHYAGMQSEVWVPASEILASSPRSKSPPLPISASSPLLSALASQSPDARRALATLHSQTLGVLADLIGVRFVVQLPQSPAIQAMLEAEPPQPEDEQKAAAGDQPAQNRLRGRRWLLGQMRLKAPGTPPSLPASQSPSLPPPAPSTRAQAARRQYVADLLALIQQQEAADLLDTSFTERRAAMDAEDAADHGEASTNLAGAKLRAKLRLQQLATVRARFFRQDNAVRELHQAEQSGRQDVEKAAAMAALATGRIGQRRNGAAWRTIGFTERRQLALLGIGVDQSSSGDQGGYPYTLSRRGMAEARVEFSLEGTPERQIAEEELDWMKEQEADYQTAPDDTTPAYVQNSRENWTRSLSTQGTDHILLKQEALDDLALSYPHTAALIRPEHAAREGFGIPAAQTRRPITQDSAPVSQSPSLPGSESPSFTPLTEGQSPFAQESTSTSESPRPQVSPAPSLAFSIPLSKRGQVRRAQFPDADSLAAFQFKLDADTVASARSTPTEVKKAEQRGLALLARLMEETGRSRSDLEKKLLEYHATVVQQAEAASAFGTFTPPSFASVTNQELGTRNEALPPPVGGDILSGMKGQGINRLGPPDSSDGWAWYRALERDAALSKLKPAEAQRRARKGDIADPKAKLAWLQENLVSLTSGRSIDEAATELSESQEQQFAVASGEELGQAILSALDARLAAKAAPSLADQEQTREKEALGSAQDFATYAAGSQGQPFTADQLSQELEPEDEIQIGSEYLTVLDADKDTGTLTLDSSRFGSVTVSGAQTLNLASGPNHLRISKSPRLQVSPPSSSSTLATARAELIAAVEEDTSLGASKRWPSQKLREEVLRLNLPESRMRERRGARAWLTPSATWINVLDHGDVFPADMPGGDGRGMSWYGQMHAAGFVRVADIPRAAGPGGRGGSTTERMLVAEYHARQLTTAQRRELENTAIERGAELFLNPQPLAASNRTRLAAASYVEEAIKDHSFRTLADLLRFAATDLPAQVFAKLRTPHLYNAWNTVQVENNRPEATRPEEAAALRALAPQVERRYGEMPPDIAARDAAIDPALLEQITGIQPADPAQEDNTAAAAADLASLGENSATADAPSIFAVPAAPDAPAMPDTPEDRMADGWNAHPEDEQLPSAPLIAKGDLDAAKPVNIQGGKSSLLARGIYNRAIAALARHASAIGDMFFGTGTVTQYIHKAGIGKPNGHASEYSPWRASFLRQVTDPAQVESLARGARAGVTELKRVQDAARAAVNGTADFPAAMKAFAGFINSLDHSAISADAWNTIRKRALSGYQTSLKDKDYSTEEFALKVEHFARVHGLKARVMIGMYQALPEGFDLNAYAQKVSAAQAWDKHLLETRSGQTAMFAPPKAEHPGPIPARDDPATTGLYIAAEMLSDNGISLDLDGAGNLNEPFTGLFDDWDWHTSDRAKNIEKLIRDYHTVFAGKTVHSANSWLLLPRLAQENPGIGFVIDPPYFGVPEMENGRVIIDTATGQPVRKGTSNYDSTTDIRTPDDLLRLFDSFVLPAWQSGAKFVLTNEWDDSAAVALRLRGATVVKIARQGRKGDTPELVAYNFNPTDGTLRPHRISAVTPGRAFNALQRGAYPGTSHSGNLDPRLRVAARAAAEAQPEAARMALQQRQNAAQLPRGNATGGSGRPVGADGRSAPRTPALDATLAGGPNWDATTSAKVAWELDQNQGTDPLDESPEVEALDYEAQLQEDADRYGSPSVNEDNDVNDVTLAASKRQPSTTEAYATRLAAANRKVARYKATGGTANWIIMADMGRWLDWNQYPTPASLKNAALKDFEATNTLGTPLTEALPYVTSTLNDPNNQGNPTLRDLRRQHGNDPQQLATLLLPKLQEQHKAVTSANADYLAGAHADDPFFQSAMLRATMSDLTKSTVAFPVTLYPVAVAETRTAWNDGKLHSLPAMLEHYQQHAKAAAEIALRTRHGAQTVEGLEGGEWVTLPQVPAGASQSEQDAIFATWEALSHPNWCTSRGMARSYAPEGKMAVYRKNGTSLLAIRFRGDDVVEVQSASNNGSIPLEYLPEVENYAKQSDSDLTRKTLEKTLERSQQEAKRLQEIAERNARFLASLPVAPAPGANWDADGFIKLEDGTYAAATNTVLDEHQFTPLLAHVASGDGLEEAIAAGANIQTIDLPNENRNERIMLRPGTILPNLTRFKGGILGIFSLNQIPALTDVRGKIHFLTLNDPKPVKMADGSLGHAFNLDMAVQFGSTALPFDTTTTPDWRNQIAELEKQLETRYFVVEAGIRGDGDSFNTVLHVSSSLDDALAAAQEFENTEGYGSKNWRGSSFHVHAYPILPKSIVDEFSESRLASSNRFPLERALAPTTGTSALFKPNTPPPVAGKQSAVAGSEPPTANRQPLTDHHALLQQAFAQAALGSSSQWLPIRAVWDQFHAQNPAVTPAAFMRSVKAGDDAGTVFLSPPESAATVEAAGPFKLRNASGIMSTDMMVPLATSKRTTKPQQTSGFLTQKGGAWTHGESRLIQGLTRINTDQRTSLRLVPGESEKPETYTRAGRSIPPYTERADLNDLVAEEGALIARAKAEGFFWDKPQVDQITAFLGDSGGGTEHDVWLVNKDKASRIVIRSTILDSYGFMGRSPAQYLQRLQNYNAAFPGLQTRLIGVSRNTRGNGVIWTAQPFVDGVELKDDKRLQSMMEAKGWVRIDGPGDDNIVYRHTPTGAIIRDAHAGNILVKGQELFPIDVIVTNLGSLAASDRTYSAAIEATGLAPAIKVNGRIYTGHRGMWHPEIIGHYVWKNVFTPQQRRDDPAPHFKASKYAMEEWMDSKGSGFEDFGFVDLPTGDFVDRQEAYRRLVARGVPIPPESWTARNQELDSAEILNIAAALPASDRIQHPASSIQQQVAQAASQTDPNPTDAQKRAGNYAKGKVDLHGLRISIENPAGSTRSGTDANGKPWSVTLPHHYGYILGSEGRDGDHVDVFIGPNPDSQLVLIVNQRKPGNGHFDEHKVMLGFNTPAEAARGYLASYTKGWKGLQSAVPTTIPVLKHWIATHDTTQPVTREQIEKLAKTVPLPTSAHDKPALASSDRKAQPSPMASDSGAAQPSNYTQVREELEPSPGGLSEAEVRKGGVFTLYHRGPAGFAFEAPMFFATQDIGPSYGSELKQASVTIRKPAQDSDVIKAAATIGIQKRGLKAYEYLSPNLMDSPLTPRDTERLMDELERQGFDGAVVKDSDVPFSVIPFTTAQISEVNPESSRAADGTLAASLRQRITTADARLNTLPGIEPGARLLDKATTGAGTLANRLPQAIAGTINAVTGLGQHLPGQQALAALGPKLGAADQAAAAALGNKIADGFQRVSGKDVRKAPDAVAAWLQQPAGLGAWTKNVVVDQLLPNAMLPREFLALTHEMQRKAAFGTEKSNDLIRALSGNPRLSDLAYPKQFAENMMYREQMFDAMEGRFPMASLPPEMQRLAERLRNLLKETGAELVRQGIMHPDTFAELQTNGWMPRYTLDEAMESGGSVLAAFKLGVKDLLQQRSTAYHIVDTARKGKDGQPPTVNRREGGRNAWRFRDAASRDAFYHDFVRQQTLDMLQEGGNKVVADMLAPLSRGDRAAMRSQIKTLTTDQIANTAKLSPMLAGIVKQAKKHQYDRFLSKDPFEPEKLIKDPVYAIARYVLAQTHNAATMELLRETAKHPEWVSDVALQGFTEIPDADRFGPLAGKFVQADIAAQILDKLDIPNAALRFYDAILRKWKSGKLVWNPGSHIRDAVGNTVFAYLGGSNIFNPGNWPYYQKALAVMRNGGPLYAELIENAVLGGDAYSSLVRERLKGLLPDAKTVENFNPGLIQRLFFDFGAKFHATHEQLAEYRRVPDDFYKIAAYLKAKDSMSAPEAAAHVRKWFPYYDRLGGSATTRAAGRFINPFLSFFRESTRILATAAVERPIALGAALAFPAAITALSAMLLGLDDRDREEISKDLSGRGKGILGLGGLHLFSMLLPVRSSQGQVQQFDISAIMPFADLLGQKIVPLEEKENAWQTFWRQTAAAGPVGNLGVAWITNRDLFSGRHLVEADMSTREMLGAYTQHTAGVMLPPLLPDAAAAVGIGDGGALTRAGTRQVNKTLATYDPVQTIIRSVFGMNVKSAAPNLYRQADDFRAANGYDVQPGFDYGTTVTSRAKRLLVQQLAQDTPNPQAIANLVKRLKTLGVPMDTEGDIAKTLSIIDPASLIGGSRKAGLSAEDARQRFRQSLPPESRTIYEAALSEFQRIKRRAPMLIRQAQ